MLFKEWVASDQSKSQFLKSKGINPGSGAVGRNTKAWQARKENGEGNPEATDTYVPEICEADQPHNPKAMTSQQQSASWQLIYSWRKKQSVDDWQVSDKIRMHLLKLLDLPFVPYRDQEGNIQYKSPLTPQQLRTISEVAERIQRVQRLALGLSTENLGVDLPSQPDSDPQADSEKDDSIEQPPAVPVFKVELNKRGKFVTHRPRRVK